VVLLAGTAQVFAGDNAKEKKQTIKSDFTLTLDFGRICEFGKISWNQKPAAAEKSEITTSSLGISVWGGFWGAKWSTAEPVANGDDIFSAPGKKLKLNITVLSDSAVFTVPIEEMTIEYRPISEPKGGFKKIKPDISKAEPVPKPISHIPLTDKVVTPHIKWGKPYSRGKTKVLFLTHFDMQRELLELNQRMDIEYDAPMLVKYWNRWGACTFHRSRDSQPPLKRLEKLVSENTYDVIVAGGFNWANLPESIREKLKKMVNDGAGLVSCLDPKQTGELAPLIPLGDFVPGPRKSAPRFYAPLIGEEKGTWVSARSHFITRGIPFEFLPETFYYKYTRSRSVLITANGDPILALGRYGQGKIAQFSYSSPDCWGGNCALTPAVDKTSVGYPYWEYYLSLLGKSILWAAGKEPEVTIKEISPTGQLLDRLDKKAILLSLQNTRVSDSWAPADPIKANIQVTFRDQFHNEEKTVTENHTLQAGQTQRIEIPIPADLKAGIHFADVIIDNGEKIDNWATAYFKVARKTEIAEIKFDKETYHLGDQAEVTVELSSTEENLSVRLNLYDTYNRLIATYNQKTAGTTVVFKHKLKNILSHFITAECELIKNEQILDTAKSELIVAYPHVWDDYEVIVWGITGMQILDYIIPYYYPALRDMGTTAMLEGHNFELNLRDHARHNFTIAPIGMQQGMHFNPSEIEKKFKETNDKNVLVRQPCLSNPKSQHAANQAVKNGASKYGSLGPVGYCMGDEGSLTNCGVPRYPCAAADICFSEFCMKDFRNWLKEKYDSLDKLNAEWGSDFKQWDQVLPSTKEDVREIKDGNYSSWADHREFMDDVWAGAYQRLRQSLREKDTSAGIGISGTGPPSAYTGFDYWKLGNTFDYLNLYRWICQGEIWSSFFPDKNYTHWAGYGQPDTNVRYGNWWSIVNKHKGISYFKIGWFVYPDGTLSEHGQAVRDSLKDILKGIGKISITSKKLDDGIAILYSQSSLRAAWIIDDGKPMVKTSKYEYHVKNNEGPGISWGEIRHIDNLDTYCMLLKGAGLNYKFVSYEQVAAGELSKYKALILPYAMAISYKETEAIKKFVNDGGIVIADVAPAVMNGNCKTLKKSSLSDLFGADITGFDWVRKPGTVEMPKTSLEGVDFDSLTIDNAVGTLPVKPTTAKSLGQFRKDADTAQTLLVNTYGKGKAVFLNFFLSNLNDIFTGQRDSQLLSRLLQTGGVTGRVKIVTNPQSLHDYETAVFQNGSVEYLVVLRGTAETIQNLSSKGVEIVLPKDCFIYNIREGKSVGFGKKINVPALLLGDAAVYALLPYEVKDILLKTDRKTYRPGQSLQYALQITAKSNATVGNQVVRLEVYDPAGRFCRHYSENILTKAGLAEGSISLALNDKPGLWTIKACDLTTGKTTQAQVRLLQN